VIYLDEEAFAEVVRHVVREELERLPYFSATSPWMTLEEAADYCRMTSEALDSARKRKQVYAHKSETRRIRYRREDLDKFLSGEGLK
jgi:dihydrodipicolinate synthase/N-acetylneuraminate lyase